MKIKYFKNFDDFMYNPKIYETEKEKAAIFSCGLRSKNFQL